MTRNNWEEKAAKLLVGKKIKTVSYLSAEEMKAYGWSKAAIAIELEDGTVLVPSMDDEGNDGGALFTSDKKLPVIPTM